MTEAMNLYRVFADRVATQPDHPAIVGPREGARFTYAELKEAIDAAAGRLSAAGVESGHSVGLHVPSGTDYIVLTYALWRVGACVVPIPVELTPVEKARICTEIGMDSVLSTGRGVAVLENHYGEPAKAVSDDLHIAPVAHRRPDPPEFASINGAFLRFTSGTTGDSKGVVLSHRTIFDRIHAANEALRVGPDDRVIWLLSMSYHFAVSIVSYLSFGATIVMCRDHFGTTIVRTTAEQEGTLIYGSPIHYQLISKDATGIELPSLRLPISTTTALEKRVAEAFRERFGIPVLQAYGIIEVGLPCINLDAGDKPGSVGKPLPAYEMHLEPTTHQGPPYRIKFRAKGILDAYYEPWRTRDQICEDGWFDTGDLGVTDEDGYLFITGRAKEMISVGGMKFFPQEVEKVIGSDPRISEACVSARYDERMGEVPVAQVVVREGERADDALKEELIGVCKHSLAPFKIPREIEFVAELERTASGKLIRARAEG